MANTDENSDKDELSATLNKDALRLDEALPNPLQTFIESARELLSQLKPPLSEKQAYKELAQHLQQIEQNLDTLQNEADQAAYLQYQPNADTVSKIKRLETWEAKFKQQYTDTVQEHEKKISNLEEKLQFYERCLTQNTLHDMLEQDQQDIQQQSKLANIEKQIREKKSALLEEETACWNRFFSCCPTGLLKKLRKELTALQTERDELTKQSPSSNSTLREQAKQKITETRQALEVLIQSKPNVEELEKKREKVTQVLSELKASVEAIQKKMSKNVSNRCMFFCIRIYENLLLLQKNAQSTQSPNASSFKPFLDALRSGILKLFSLLKNLFCAHSEDHTGEYFCGPDGFQKLKPSIQKQILGPEGNSPLPALVEQLVPSMEGDILKQHANALVETDSTPAPPLPAAAPNAAR